MEGKLLPIKAFSLDIYKGETKKSEYPVEKTANLLNGINRLA